jgi:hypothetical protein
MRSVPASESFLIQARELYQTPLTEPLLIGLPIVLHVLSGIAVRLLRRSQNLRRYGGSTPGMYALHKARNGGASSSSSLNSSNQVRIWPQVSYISIAGYATASLVFAHVAMNRVLPLKFEGDSSNIGLGYIAHGFARHGLVSWVSYVGLIGGFCGHMVWGTAKWMGITPPSMTWRGSSRILIDKTTLKQRRRMWWAINGLAAVVAALWAAGGLGIVARDGLTDGWVGKLYDGLLDKLPF